VLKSTTEENVNADFEKHSKRGKKSKRKGSSRELEWVHYLKKRGITSARRTSQFNGKTGGLSDVVTDVELPRIHHEVKGGQQLNIHEAVAQAIRDAKALGLVPVVAHRKNRTDWVVTMHAEDWLKFALAFEEVGVR